MKVFISYTRNKNASGAVSRFVDHLKEELQSWDQGATVFIDIGSIDVGDYFPDKIEQALHDADVLLVLVSPAWLSSKWCRQEFEWFSDNQEKRGRRPCILPILSVMTNAIQESSNDPIAQKLAKIDYDDWRSLRHQAWNNPEPLKAIADLAEKAVRKVPTKYRIEGDEEALRLAAHRS